MGISVRVAPWVRHVVALVGELRSAGAGISDDHIERMTNSRAFADMVEAGIIVEMKGGPSASESR